MTKQLLIILNVIALLGALIWLMLEQGWEPLVTSIGLVSSLISLLFLGRQSGNATVMKQKGGKNSKNYQAKGDINIR
jgi:hypothetical protein